MTEVATRPPRIPTRDPERLDGRSRGAAVASENPAMLSRLVSAARGVALAAAERASSLDADGCAPDEDIDGLRRAGLMRAPAPAALGGAGLGDETGAWALGAVLRLLGWGNLSLGRLYEGHANALGLIGRYAASDQKRRLFADARDGHLFGVWNTDTPAERLTHGAVGDAVVFDGGKIFASGAGRVTRPVVTSRPRADPEGPPTLFVVPLEPGERADLSAWRAHGMRASASGSVDFSGLSADAACVVGHPGDYGRQPYFSAGAWRFAAVQVGGVEAVVDAWREHLRVTGRGDDPHQAMRLGEGAIAAETARLWVERAAAIADDPAQACDTVLAYVGLARCAVERCGLLVMELAQRSVGLQGFLRDHPLERLCRDLATYLRQPGPDGALTAAAAHVLRAPDGVGGLWHRGAEPRA